MRSISESRQRTKSAPTNDIAPLTRMLKSATALPLMSPDMRVFEPITSARNSPAVPEKAAAELERCFKAGAHGLKIWKDVGLTFKNPDGTYIQADDARFDPVWEMCARYNKPVMIHISDSYGRFLPIGPENDSAVIFGRLAVISLSLASYR